MKFFILIFFFPLLHYYSWSQQFVKTTTPCNNELLKKTPGRWIKAGDNLYAKVSKQQQQEIFNRLEAIHQFVQKTYPTPIGVDAAWRRLTSNESFASELTKNSYGNYDIVKGIPIVSFFYNCGFFGYSCGRNQYELMTGYPGETTTYLTIYANSLANFFAGGQVLGPELKEIMCINGRPIKKMPSARRTWKGYTVCYTEAGSTENIILLHREGSLPYIPVTRKQYLERCIEYIPKFFTVSLETLKAFELIGDKQEQAGQLKKKQKIKEDVLKHYQDELAATTAAGLLDSPAIIPLAIFNIGNQPIFTTEAKGGNMLITENPVYMSNDLPKYIPQLFVMKWHCDEWKPLMDVCKAIEENFPIEKLQAMINK